MIHYLHKMSYNSVIFKCSFKCQARNKIRFDLNLRISIIEIWFYIFAANVMQLIHKTLIILKYYHYASNGINRNQADGDAESTNT